MKSKVKCNTHHHVGISDCFYLVNIVTFDDSVKQSVQIIQEVNNLQNIHSVKIKGNVIVRDLSIFLFL